MLSDGGITNMSSSATETTNTTFEVVADICSVGILNVLLDIVWMFAVYGGLCAIAGFGAGLVFCSWYLRKNVIFKEK